jgi:hypothetical protein
MGTAMISRATVARGEERLKGAAAKCGAIKAAFKGALRDLAPATERMPDARFLQWAAATAYDHASDAHRQVTDAIAPLLTAYYPNNFLQALAEGPALLLLMSLAWLAPRRAGVVAGVFLAGLQLDERGSGRDPLAIGEQNAGNQFGGRRRDVDRSPASSHAQHPDLVRE